MTTQTKAERVSELAQILSENYYTLERTGGDAILNALLDHAVGEFGDRRFGHHDDDWDFTHEEMLQALIKLAHAWNESGELDMPSVDLISQ